MRNTYPSDITREEFEMIREEYNVPQKLDTELQNYRDGDIIKITNISSGGNRK